MKKIALFPLLCLLSSPLVAQRVEFVTPTIVHITHQPDGKTSAPEPSLVVTAQPQKVKVAVTKQEDATLYQSTVLKVEVREGKVNFYTLTGEPLLREGQHTLTRITEGVDKGAYKVLQTFQLERDEPIYGLGMLQNGKMNQRGEKRLMMQSNLEDYSHFFQSIKGYGIYWDNYSPTDIRDTEAEGLTLESQVGQAVDYYFLYGGNADGVIREMRYLTGRVPMLPLWTYGFHQSRERYKSQAELLEVVRKYREQQIPFDGIIQDWQYWGSNYTWNAMEFISDDFAQAQRMIDEVHNKNAHMSISIWASFGPHTKPFQQLKERNLLYSFETWPESGMGVWPPRKDYPSGVRVYDAYSKQARDIYWDNLSRLHKMGIDAWWMDSTDPDHVNYRESDLDEQRPLTLADGSEKMVSYRSVRNLFPFMTVGGVYDHQRAVDSTKRVFILTRSYFTGQQRYGANTWSGDVSSSWDSFRKQVPLCLNYTLTGNPHVNTDIGGFFAGRYNQPGFEGTQNPHYQELYVRWMQFGLFNPMMRSHGTEVYRELYYYGRPGEPVYDALLSAVKMRYRLLPYIYSTSWQVSRHDDSFMRPLMMDFKDDKRTWDNNREFLFGRSLLVCPVVDPLYTSEDVAPTWDKTQGGHATARDKQTMQGLWGQPKTYAVYLPEGTDWYDYWTHERLTGGQMLQAKAPLSHSPLYVRAGSILPLGPDMQYSSEKKWDALELRIYPGRDAHFTLYEDEGDNYNYEKGKYTEIAMQWNDRARTLTLGARQGAYAGMLATRTFTIVLPDGSTKTVSYKGKKVTVKM